MQVDASRHRTWLRRGGGLPIERETTSQNDPPNASDRAMAPPFFLFACVRSCLGCVCGTSCRYPVQVIFATAATRALAVAKKDYMCSMIQFESGKGFGLQPERGRGQESRIADSKNTSIRDDKDPITPCSLVAQGGLGDLDSRTGFRSL